MNINTYIPKERLSDYQSKEWYLCTVDLQQKEKYELKGTDLTLFVDVDKGLNHRNMHPNIGVITHTAGDAKFKVGDKLLCKHFTFRDAKRNVRVFHQDYDRTDYFMVHNSNIMFGIADDKLVPREGVLLCEKVYPKDNTLVGLKDILGSRRDVAKVLDVWEGCEDIKRGDYVLLASGGDYLFDWKDEEYIKADVYGNDVLAVIPNEDWEVNEIRRHVKHEHSFKWK